MAATFTDHPLKIRVVVDLAQLLIMSALWINFPIPAGVTRVVNRRRTRVVIGVALALILLASWLAFDHPLLRARATNFQDGHGSGAADGRPAGAGSTGLAQVVSEPARGDTRAHGGDGGASSDAHSSHSSGAVDYAHTEQDGKGRSSAERGTTGTGGSHPGSGGAAASSTQAAGPGMNPDVSTSSDALPSGPAAGTQPQLVASGRNGTPQSGPPASTAPANQPGPPGGTTGPVVRAESPGSGSNAGPDNPSGRNGSAPQSGPAAPGAPANQPPLNAGQSGPPGGTTGPVVRAESPGSGSNTGPDNPDRWGSGTSGLAAGSDGSPNPIPVPVPPSLLLFGASALVLWFVSRR